MQNILLYRVGQNRCEFTTVDLPEKLEEVDTHPIHLQNTKINSLMWADDIILLSEAKEGCNNALTICKISA